MASLKLENVNVVWLHNSTKNSSKFQQTGIKNKVRVLRSQEHVYELVHREWLINFIDLDEIHDIFSSKIQKIYFEYNSKWKQC